MNRILSWCSAAALLLVPACGDSKPAPGEGGAGANAPSADSAAKPSTGSQSPAPSQPKAAVRPVRIDMVMAKALWGNEPSSPKPDSPATDAMIALGRMLYHSKQLSQNGDVSCASCHDLANYGQDGKPKSTGTGGQVTARNTPPVWNAFREFAQGWDYRAASVEEHAVQHVMAPATFGLADEAALVAKIQANPELVKAFGTAFGDGEPVSAQNFGRAVGAFERTLVTKSRFDAFLDGDSRALSNEEKHGLKEFMDVGCQTCHMSRLVGGSMQQKVGVFSSYGSTDTGRFGVTGNEVEKFFFKVPSLENIDKTAPYNHDGRVATLEEAVKQMAKMQLNKDIDDEQVASIVAFLKTLTGPLPAEIVAPK